MEQVLDGPALHEICADQSGEDDRALYIFLSGLGQAQQQESDECNRNLDAYGILRGAYEPGDLESLLDPAEEQFDGPTPAVEIGELLGAGIEIVRQDAKHCSALGRYSHLAHCVLHWIAAASGLARGEEADAVGEDAAAFRDRQLFDRVERGVGLEPGDDPAADGVELSPPSIIVIAEIADLGGAPLDPHLLGHGDTIDLGHGNCRIDP